jgi:hypothetical protein
MQIHVVTQPQVATKEKLVLGKKDGGHLPSI